jgi:hypothetical protein
MKFLTGAVLSAMLFAAGPAMADRGDDRGHGHKQWKHTQHFDKHRGHHYAPPRYVVRRDVHHYYQPAPRYYAPAHVYAPAPVYRPSAGIHITLPNFYIPLH